MEFLNIVTEKRNPGEQPWILRRAAEEIQKTFPKTTINKKPRQVNYFINYALHAKMEGVLVGHFTHMEFEGHARTVFGDTARIFDYATCTSKVTRDILLKLGVPKERIFIIRYGCDERMHRRPVFGVVGRVYGTGRKGEYLVQKMVNSGYDVKAWGKGWPVLEGDQWSQWENLPGFYDSIDYLVVPSINEGGPVPVIDAIAAGVPVIAPNCGWCWEFPVLQYDLGSWESLESILEKLSNPPTWRMWSDDHYKVLSSIAVKAMKKKR